ncbi:MAG TPA: transglycosylase SLT domain-containing protein [Vicinamibacterales bacterium]
MSVVAASGLALLLFVGFPGCTEPQTAPPTLPASSFPEITATGQDPVDALKALDARRGANPSIEADVLRARLLGEAGRHAESADAWEAVAAAEPALSAFARRAMIRASLAAGSLDRAAAAIDRLLSDGPATDHTDVALEVATRLRTAGRHDEARALYGRVLEANASGSRAEEARLGIAESLAATGDTAGALAELRRVRVTFGNFEAYEAAKRAEIRVANAAGTPVPPVTADEYSTMTERLLARSRYDEAIVLFEQQLEIENGAGAARVEAAIVDTLYRARQNSKARDRIKRFRSRFPGSSYDDEMTVLDFRIAIREARTADVRRLGYAIMRGRVPGVSTADRRGIGRLVGSYLAAVGQVNEALDVFREMFQSSRSTGEQEDLLWRAGITALRAGDLDRAKSNLEGLIRRRPGAETVRIARFWIADAEAKAGRKGEAARIWASLADEQPLDYYGLRAADRIGRTNRVGASAPAAPDLTVRDETRAAPELKAARILSAAGFTSEAAAFARQAAERFPSDLGMAFEAARASAAAGEYRAAHSLMARRFPTYITRGGRDLPPEFLRLFWPMAFEAQIVEAAKRANIDPLVMLSIARRESRYDPGVRSLVGAIGLFQFMPYTAEEIGPAAGLTDVSEAALKTPFAASRLAATYLAELLRRFDGELAPAAASYNAGEDLATIWWKAHKAAGVDMFVEMIPYAETRGYVREVVANYETYQWLYRN